MATSSETLRLETAESVELSRCAPIARNVVFSVFDYLVQPLLMLVTARYLVRMLGISMFGIWILVLAIIGSSGSICTGFGDAALKYVAAMRGRLDRDGVARVIAAALVLNSSLGLGLAVALSVLAPWASGHVFHLSGEVRHVFVVAVRWGACLLVVRSLAFVFIGALRAFERYPAVTKILFGVRLATALAVLALAWRGFGVVAMVLSALVCEFVALFFLARAGTNLWRRRVRLADIGDWRGMTSFGFFNWIQAIAGTLFSQADRLLVAALLGPAALSYYGVCIQCAQPIHGLTAAGNNVLFPHLSARIESHGESYLRSILARAFRIDALCVAGLTLAVIIVGRPFLAVWMGGPFAQHASKPLILVALSFALLALNIPGHYGLLALGEVRFVTALNIAGCVLSLAVAWALVPALGIAGAAIGRLSYGPVTWLVYWRLRRRVALRTGQAV